MSSIDLSKHLQEDAVSFLAILSRCISVSAITESRRKKSFLGITTKFPLLSIKDGTRLDLNSLS